MKTCLACGQVVPIANPFGNAPIKQRIYDFIVRHPSGVTTQQIVDHVWKDDADGGPTASTIVAVHIAGMNRMLKAYHAKIRSTRGQGARYRLERNPSRKMSNKAVGELRSLKGVYSHRKLARMFGIAYSTVGLILRGEIHR